MYENKKNVFVEEKQMNITNIKEIGQNIVKVSEKIEKTTEQAELNDLYINLDMLSSVLIEELNN